MFLLREMMQSCEGAMKSLRSDACSTGENLLDDIVGRPGGTPNRFPDYLGWSSPPQRLQKSIRAG